MLGVGLIFVTGDVASSEQHIQRANPESDTDSQQQKQKLSHLNLFAQSGRSCQCSLRPQREHFLRKPLCRNLAIAFLNLDADSLAL